MWEGGGTREVREDLLNSHRSFWAGGAGKATVTRKLEPVISWAFLKVGHERVVLGICPAHAFFPSPPLVAQKVVTLRKQQQLLAACKSLPSSPSHSAASTPVAGQVSQDFMVQRRAGGN